MIISVLNHIFRYISVSELNIIYDLQINMLTFFLKAVNFIWNMELFRESKKPANTNVLQAVNTLRTSLVGKGC